VPAQAAHVATKEGQGRRTVLQSFCQGRLFAERTSPAPAEVIGLHGWARSREDLAGPLAGLNALAIDLPGFGASPEPPQAWGSEGYAAMIAEVVTGLGRPQVLLGHSFGGRVAVKLAAGWPELVSGLVLAGVPLLRQQSARVSPAWRFRVARWGSRHGLVSGARIEKLRGRYGSEDYRRASGVMRSVLVRVVNESYEQDLPRITCPVELVWGSNDTAAPLPVARQACGLLPNARLEVIEGAGHMTPLTAPDALRRSVKRLVRASIA
jgi:pimeloyl-ACP methyl ester carboxylesterase